MEIARSLGNYSLGDADLLRRAMGKKKQKEMEDHRSRFILGCKENDINSSISKSIFDKMEKFAGYGFNKSHSVAYAMLSYQTAFLKSYYPTEFYSAALSSDMDNTSKIINLLSSCKQSNIEIKLPDINNSNYKFSPLKNKVINYGLGAIKGVGENAAKHIWDIKTSGGNYKSIDDFCSRVNLSIVNSGTIESLISSGCFDSISNKTRSENQSDIHLLISQGHKKQLDLAAGQSELFDTVSSVEIPHSECTQEIVKLAPSNLELTKERKVLGYYLSGHPIKAYEKEISDMNLKNISNINALIINSSTSKFNSTIAGVIIDSRSQKISKNKFITIYKVDDGTHQINISFFEEKYLQYKNLLKEDELLFFNGEIFIDDYDSQLSMRAERVYTLTDAREKYSKYLSVVFPSELLSKEKLEQIKSIFEKYNSGKTKIKLSYKTRDFIAPISLSKDIYVQITDKLLSDIKLLTGNDSVTIKYQ
jgi:DNA polymerase-3 subunit alpha